MSRRSRRNNRTAGRTMRRWSPELRVGLTLFSVIFINLMFGAIGSTF